jgi:hypothetical protein
MKSLVDSIGSGDLTGARAAFDALQKNRQGAASTTSTDGTSQRDQDIAAIGKALDSGDADAARQALAKLRDDGKQAAAARGTQGAQETQGTQHAHHHHGHRAPAADGTSSSAGTQTAALTYSASASTTPAAAPGSTIDVSA